MSVASLTVEYLRVLDRLVRRRAAVEFVEEWLGPDWAGEPVLSSRLGWREVFVDTAAESRCVAGSS